MKVKDLIAKLQMCNPEAEVMRETPSGDYWRTMLARPIDAVSEAYVTYSEYHLTNKIIDDIDDVDDNSNLVIILE